MARFLYFFFAFSFCGASLFGALPCGSSFLASNSARGLSASSTRDFGTSRVWVASARSRVRRSASFFARSSASLPCGFGSPATATVA
jgi:hypothetical protein